MRSWTVCALVVLLGGGCFYAQEQDPFAGLGEGDVVVRITGVPPGTSVAVGPLPGARGRVVNSAVVRSAAADGRMVFRNLPEGTHRLVFVYDPNRDGVPDLARVSEAPISIRSRNGESRRVTLSLGDVRLLPPGSIRGTVQADAAVPFAEMLVAVEGVDRAVTPDSTGAFVFPGLGEGPWRIMAAGGGRISAVVDVAVTSDQTTPLAAPLVLGQPGSGTVLVDLHEFPTGGSTLTPGTVDNPLSAPVTVELLREETGGVFAVTCLPVTPTTLAGCAGVFDGDQAVFRDVPHGVYVVRVTGAGFVPLVVKLVAVQQGDNTVTVLLDPQAPPPANGCVDQDGDGLCAMTAEQMRCGSAHGCAAACRTRSAQTMDEACDALDCDDDSDGQADVVEAAGCCAVELPGPCQCGALGPDPLAGACQGDPTRSDVDLDGVCDVFDRANAPNPCSGVVVLPDGGVDLPDASVGDGGVMEELSVDLLNGPSYLAGDTVHAAARGLDGETAFVWSIAPTATDLDPQGPSAERRFLFSAQPGNYTITATTMRAGRQVSGTRRVLVRPALPVVLGVLDLAAGFTHTVMVAFNNVVLSQGGQLGLHPRYLHGDGTATRAATQAEFPGVVQGVSGRGVLRATRVCAGNEFSVAISMTPDMMDDRVVAWGRAGMLGLGSGGSDSAVPVFVPEPGTGFPILAKDIACGEDHAVALGMDGQTIYTWGGNDRGQLGIGGAPNNFEVHVVRPGGASVVFDRVFAAGKVSGALTNMGTLYVWGDDTQGQSGVVGDRLDVPTPVSGVVAAGVTMVRVALGPRDILAQTSDGQMLSVGGWGTNAAVGVQRTAFTPITGNGILPDSVDGLGSGPDMGFIISQGVLHSFGGAASATLLGRDTSTMPASRPGPVLTVDGLMASNVGQVSVGARHTVYRNGGIPLGFGANDQRQLGPPSQSNWDRAQPIPLLNCGSPVLELSEQCDDGGFDTGDGCDATCRLEAACALAQPADPPVGADELVVPPGCRTFGATRSLDPQQAPDFYRLQLVAGVYMVHLRGVDARGAVTCGPSGDVRLLAATGGALPDVSQTCTDIGGNTCMMFAAGECTPEVFTVFQDGTYLLSVSATGTDPSYSVVVSPVSF